MNFLFYFIAIGSVFNLFNILLMKYTCYSFIRNLISTWKCNPGTPTKLTMFNYNIQLQIQLQFREIIAMKFTEKGRYNNNDEK